MSETLKSIHRVAILGAESTGKSALAEALAKHYQTTWVPEYLREFVDTHQRVPTQHEQLHIAQTQLQREKSMLAQANQWLFCDTTPLMTSIYSRFYFDEVDEALEELVAQHTYDFILVTAPDFPWTPDGLQRESAAVRDHIHHELMQSLEESETPFLLVEGSLEERLAQVTMTFDFLSS